MVSLSVPWGWRQGQKSGLATASAGTLAKKILEPSRPQLEDPGVSQHPEGVCWPREEKTQSQFTLEPLLIPLSKTTTGNFFDFSASPSSGCACLPACPRATGEAGSGDWVPLPLSLEILIRYSVKLAPNQGSSHLNLEMGVESWNRFEPVHNELQLGLCFIIILAFTLTSCARIRTGLVLLSLASEHYPLQTLFYPDPVCLPLPVPFLCVIKIEKEKEKKGKYKIKCF